jgi:hypothetical protein
VLFIDGTAEDGGGETAKHESSPEIDFGRRLIGGGKENLGPRDSSHKTV